MPQLTFRGFTPPQVAQATPQLASRLAALLACPEDYFTFDCLDVLSFSGGAPVPTAPFIEVLWFDRGKAVRDEAAGILNETFVGMGMTDLEICFKAVEPAVYYGNGIPYGQK